MVRLHGSIGVGLAFVLIAALPLFPHAAWSSRNPQPATVPVEVIALDRDGTFADNLTPASFAVAVDGKPRQVLWIRHVSRGPGSLDEAGRRQSSGTGALRFAAEPTRSMLVVVDETSIERGSERAVIQAAGALVDRFGLDDHIGVVRIPITRDSHVALTTERAAVRAALRQVVGQAARAGLPAVDARSMQPQPPANDTNRAAGDPAQAINPERERLPTEVERPGLASDEGTAPAAGFMASFHGVLKALQPIPVRKLVAVFSGGLPQGGTARIDELARAAVASHATIYAFGFSGTSDDRSSAAGLSALERLARSTGGSFTMVGKNADKSIARMIPEMSACYVLGIEGATSDADGKRHTLRVEASRQLLTIRAPEWFIPRADLEDVVPPSPAPMPGPGHALELSFDATKALAIVYSSPNQLLVLPTGAGEQTSLTVAGFNYLGAGWYHDGRRVVFVAQRQGQPLSAYSQDVEGGAPTRLGVDLGPFATRILRWAWLLVSPDGKWFTGRAGPPTLVPIEGSQLRALPNLGDTDIPVGWTEDGLGLFVNRNGSTEGAVQIVRVDLVTGAIVAGKEIVPRDVVGLQERPVCLVTPDGRTIVYSTKQYLTDLYLVEGLK
jgi:VWFA-related protein